MKKLQVAFEYLIIVSVIAAFIVPVWIYVSGMQRQTVTELSLSYAKNAAEKIADTANLVYSQGPPAKVNVKIYIPGGVQDINISNRTINFRVAVGDETSDVFATSMAPLNGTLPAIEGTYWVDIEASSGMVQIGIMQ